MLKYVQVFVNNKWCAGLNENKEVSFSKNSRTIELCLSIYRCAKEGKFMQIVLVPIQRKIKYNVVDTFIRVFFFVVVVLPSFTIAIVKQLHYTYIRCYTPLIPLHSVTSGQQLYFSGSRPTHSVCWTFFPYRLSQCLTQFYPKTLLWIVQRHEFALHIDLDTFTLASGRIISVNLGARRQKSQVITTMFWHCQLFFVKWMRAIVLSSLIWNTANWIINGSNH